jgi:hypothetical protein
MFRMRVAEDARNLEFSRVAATAMNDAEGDCPPNCFLVRADHGRELSKRPIGIGIH